MSDKKKLRKIIFEMVNEAYSNGITVYHRSDDYPHMVNSDFRMELSDDEAAFGNAIYFSDSPKISPNIGKYMCKFEIIPRQPMLDMNMLIDCEFQKEIIARFNRMAHADFEMEVDCTLGSKIQFGDVLKEIEEEYLWEGNKYFQQLIQSFGYHSFKYYSTISADFSNKRTNYGICYGIYNPQDIIFIEDAWAE
jgi:hypothetical protein